MSTPIHAIRIPIGIDRGLGRLAEETDYAAHVEQLMLQVLFTAPGERVNRPDFGCGLGRMVFAPNSEASANLLKVTIGQSLQTWLGDLIRVEEVKTSANGETLDVGIVYMLHARPERRFLNLEVTV